MKTLQPGNCWQSQELLSLQGLCKFYNQQKIAKISSHQHSLHLQNTPFYNVFHPYVQTPSNSNANLLVCQLQTIPRAIKTKYISSLLSLNHQEGIFFQPKIVPLSSTALAVFITLLRVKKSSLESSFHPTQIRQGKSVYLYRENKTFAAIRVALNQYIVLTKKHGGLGKLV